MDSKKILEEFATTEPESAKAIGGTHILQYESEYGTNLVSFTDEMLFDFFLIKKRYYRPLHISKLVGQFGQFYEYCISQGYIEFNPFNQSLLFTRDYIINKIASLGNVELYSREYVINKCKMMGYNVPYYTSIALLLYDGIKNQKELASLKYSDVDFYNKTVNTNGFELSLKDDTIAAISDMYDMSSFNVLLRSKETKWDFYDRNGFLIRQTVSPRTDAPADDIEQHKKVISRKFNALCISPIFLSDSSIIFRLIDEIGKDTLLSILSSSNRTDYRQQDINLMKTALGKLNITTPVKNLLFDYKVYAPLIKHNKIL
ncbi:hypothetical protein [Clostridium sp. HBUAS56010]|uniref:hypothetical protein n=1 Tax=Clostridium sp. HBUAS56010 TaxID=2571127 RepID=UPI0011789145|nr:hypothetical protein [Clostridium sp. HBUAS56010]